MGLFGIGTRQRHRHVHVGHAGLERAVEDRHHEARVRGVQQVRDPAISTERRDAGGVGRVEPRRLEPLPVLVGDDACAFLVDVGEDDALVEVAPGGDRGERRSDPAGPGHEDLHGAECTGGGRPDRRRTGAGRRDGCDDRWGRASPVPPAVTG